MHKWPFVVVGALALARLAIGCGGSDQTPASAPASASSSSAGGGTCTADAGVDPPLDPPVLHTARWAFEPWISKDISTTDDTYAFVDGFQSRDIPVGVVVLDSPWETNYNTFVPNPKRYHDFGKLVTDMHAKGVRLVVWMTAFVNTSSFDLEDTGDVYTTSADGYDEAQACGFFVDQGTTYGWWKGVGGSIDFENPAAITWWHRRQDPFYDLGFDGFKLDFGDSYVTSDPVQTSKGPIPHQQYSEDYYRDYYAYGQKKRGKDFVTMVRAWDASYSFKGRFFAKKEDAPVTWMGDNRRDYVGLADALDEMFRSAAAGYAVVGSDVGGYLDRDDVDLTKLIPLDPIVFSRWTAVGALSPFMELHGRANLTPWTVPQQNDQITTLYRYWSKLHHELVPFFYSLTEATYAGAAPPLRPIGDEKSWAGDYRFTLGDALFVAPILDKTGKRDVVLPAGAGYYDWFAPMADPIPGGTTVMAYDATDPAKIPLFVRSGAIIPMNVSDDVTGAGDAASAGKTTWLVYPDAKMSSFDAIEDDDKPTNVTASAMGASFSIALSRALHDTILRVRTDTAVSNVTAGGTPLVEQATHADFDAAASGYWLDASTRSVWVKIKAGGATTIAGS